MAEVPNEVPLSDYVEAYFEDQRRRRQDNLVYTVRLGAQKLANEIGARRFNIPTHVWNKMTMAERWAANQKFLDRTIARGDAIILSNPVKNINDVSGAFRQELDYLIKQGFRLSEDGTQMIR